MHGALRVILICLTLIPAAATAGSDSMVAASVGTSLGISNTVPFGETKTDFTTELTLGVKFVRVIGLELGYSPTESVDSTDELVFDSTFRLSGLLYLVPTQPVDFYVKVGLGAGSFSDLFDIDGPTTSYQAGAGVNWYIDDHFVVGAEFMLLLPGVNSIRDTLETFANDELKRYQAALTEGDAPEEETTPLTFDDIISADNFRFSLSARYYF